MVLRGALFVDALLRFPFLALAFLAALFGFHYILAQFAIGAEETAIGDYKFRFLLFFCHKFRPLELKGSVCTVALCSPTCTVVPGVCNFAPQIAERQRALAAGKRHARRARDLSHVFVVGANLRSRLRRLALALQSQ